MSIAIRADSGAASASDRSVAELHAAFRAAQDPRRLQAMLSAETGNAGFFLLTPAVVRRLLTMMMPKVLEDGQSLAAACAQALADHLDAGSDPRPLAETRRAGNVLVEFFCDFVNLGAATSFLSEVGTLRQGVLFRQSLVIDRPPIAVLDDIRMPWPDAGPDHVGLDVDWALYRLKAALLLGADLRHLPALDELQRRFSLFGRGLYGIEHIDALIAHHHECFVDAFAALSLWRAGVDADTLIHLAGRRLMMDPCGPELMPVLLGTKPATDGASANTGFAADFGCDPRRSAAWRRPANMTLAAVIAALSAPRPPADLDATIAAADAAMRDGLLPPAALRADCPAIPPAATEKLLLPTAVAAALRAEFSTTPPPRPSVDAVTVELDGGDPVPLLTSRRGHEAAALRGIVGRALYNRDNDWRNTLDQRVIAARQSVRAVPVTAVQVDWKTMIAPKAMTPWRFDRGMMFSSAADMLADPAAAAAYQRMYDAPAMAGIARQLLGRPILVVTAESALEAVGAGRALGRAAAPTRVASVMLDILCRDQAVDRDRCRYLPTRLREEPTLMLNLITGVSLALSMSGAVFLGARRPLLGQRFDLPMTAAMAGHYPFLVFAHELGHIVYNERNQERRMPPSGNILARHAEEAWADCFSLAVSLLLGVPPAFAAATMIIRSIRAGMLPVPIEAWPSPEVRGFFRGGAWRSLRPQVYERYQTAIYATLPAQLAAFQAATAAGGADLADCLQRAIDIADAGQDRLLSIDDILAIDATDHPLPATMAGFLETLPAGTIDVVDAALAARLAAPVPSTAEAEEMLRPAAGESHLAYLFRTTRLMLQYRLPAGLLQAGADQSLNRQRRRYLMAGPASIRGTAHALVSEAGRRARQIRPDRQD